ncbi:hypothetical protein DENSPDRAFT_568341 [Dentipellis sp. KUC8613]|nr:hypothetical protein DENSPDRAFT_568341 [Dentipellis sp. KUC8613]
MDLRLILSQPEAQFDRGTRTRTMGSYTRVSYGNAGRFGTGGTARHARVDSSAEGAGVVVLPSFRDLLAQLGQAPKHEAPVHKTPEHEATSNVLAREQRQSPATSRNFERRGPVHDQPMRECKSQTRQSRPGKAQLRTVTKKWVYKACPTCQEKVHKCSFARHKRAHLNIRFACDLCESSFTRADNQGRHLELIHGMPRGKKRELVQEDVNSYYARL